MVLVAIAAALMALLFLVFKIFDRRNIPLFPAIAVNYMIASIAGILFAPPWQAEDLSGLWCPAIGIGVLFVVNFQLTGLSAQRAGVAATTVASRMSLVLTVLAAVWLYDERPGTPGWIGIACALASVLFASITRGTRAIGGAWKLPLLIFLGNAVIDISINWMQRTQLRSETEAVFPTLIFLFSAVAAIAALPVRKESMELRSPGVLIGGAILGLINYASLVMIVKALTHGGFPASSFYPLMNVGVILIGTIASMILFGERLRSLQVMGIALAILALVLILYAQ